MGLACFLVLLSAARAAQDAVNLGKDVVKDFQQCDRDCRWVYGFYEKDITGTRVNADGSEDEWFGEHCLCSRAGRPLMEPNLIRRSVKKTWDERFWCGDFQTSNVCAMSLSTGEVGTTTRQAAAANESELHVLHCGACGACSQPDDLMVLHDTKTFITTKMTKCSIKFSMPEILGGTHDLDALTECLRNEGITFNETNSFRWDSRLQAGGPGLSCMDCWTDDIQCDAVHCKLDCIRKFFDPNNNGKYEVSHILSSFVPDAPLSLTSIYLPLCAIRSALSATRTLAAPHSSSARGRTGGARALSRTSTGSPARSAPLATSRGAPSASCSATATSGAWTSARSCPLVRTRKGWSGDGRPAT